MLENREMQLEDGRFLMNSQRYDSLPKEAQANPHIVRVHPRFLVIALALPVRFILNSL